MVPAALHDRYDIIRPLARGGMAMVHLAREVDTGREVALKQLELPAGALLAEWRLRFQQEFHTSVRLRHPNIVATFDYAESHSGCPFFTMEFLPGPGLEELIPIAPERILQLLPGLLNGLAYLHHQGLVHADIKPENLRLAADGSIRLLDLGLVTRMGQPSSGVQGTLPYLAPEVLRRAPADRRSDFYALGAVLYHLLTGAPPFTGDMREVLTGHLEKEPRRLRELLPEIPLLLDNLIRKMLLKDPLQRFQSADEVLDYLGEGHAQEDDQTLFHPPLIGRRSELKVISTAFKRIRGNCYQEVRAYGDPHVGMEAMIEEFCCRAQLQGANVLRGTFRKHMAPFEGMRGVLRGLVALARSRAGGRELLNLMPLLARIVPNLRGPIAELAEEELRGETEVGDPQQELLRLHEALTALLRLATAGAPLVLTFTDTHLADPAWCDWLEYLRRNGQDLPLLVLGTQAMEPDGDWDPSRTVLEVLPLDLGQSHEICCAILGQTDLPEDFAARVYDVCHGYPQRIVNVLQQLVANGQLKRQQGHWILPLGPLDEALALSAIAGGALAHAALPALAGAIAEALAVLGREADLLLICKVGTQLSGMEAGQSREIFEALALLEERHWIKGLDGRYTFIGDQGPEGFLATMGAERRRAIHLAIADALEIDLLDTPGDLALVADLARHALEGKDLRRGPPHALEAARQHLHLFGLEVADALLRDAIALLETDGTAPRGRMLPFYRLRADVARLAGERRLAEFCYLAGLQLAVSLGNVDAEASLYNGYGRLKMAEGALQEAVGFFKKVIGLLEHLPVHPDLVLALTQLGRCALTAGDLADASRWVLRALVLAREGHFRSLIRENMAQLGYLYVARGEGRAAEGLGLLFEALQLIERDEAKLELNACYALLGNAQLLLGRFTEAQLAFERNCNLCAEIGAAPHDEAIAFMRRAQVSLELGDYQGARRSASPAGALARLVGNRPLLAQVRVIEGMAALYQGDFLIFEDAASWAEETLAATDSDYLKAMWHANRGEAEGYLGNWSQALSSAGKALAVIAGGAGHEFLERVQILKGEALTRLGLFKPARQALDQVAPLRNDALHARLLLAYGQLERVDGKAVAAHDLGEKALALARRSGVLPLVAGCCLLLARLSRDRDEALAWTRKAVLDAEVCGQPALEAEALYYASTCAIRSGQAEWFYTAADEAWRRATGGLNLALLEAFGSTEERRPLRDAVRRRAAEGYRPTLEDLTRVLRILAAPPVIDGLFAEIMALCRDEAGATRVAVFWEDASGGPVLVLGEGPTFQGAAPGLAELEAAHEATDLQEEGGGLDVHAGSRVLLIPLAAGGHVDQPWGAMLIVGLAVDQVDRITKLLGHLGGAFWAARQLWLSATRETPRATSGS